MSTPIEELTARECAEGAAHTSGPQKGQPVQPELVPEPQVAPTLPNPVATPIAPIETKRVSVPFLKHIQEEIEAEEAKE